MRDHTKLRLGISAFLKSRSVRSGELHYQVDLSKGSGYSSEHDISGCESTILETGKILSALSESMRKN